MNSFVLKTIAIITMLIDHIGFVFLENGTIEYAVFRCIGRISFPIFCFLLVEGFYHTKNLYKYMIRLGIFCFISEIPFDLAFYDKLLSFQSQNIFFTLLIGLCVILAMEKIGKNKNIELYKAQFVKVVILLSGCLINTFIRSDYGYMGIILIVIFYIFRGQKIILTGAVIMVTAFLGSSNIECLAAFSMLLIPLYNGKKGYSLKYVFYLFYPIHLMILYVLEKILI